MRLTLLNPVSYVLGPIFQKEVRASGRRRATYIFRAVYAALLLTIVALAFQGLRQSAAHLGGVQRLQVMQSLAPSLGLIIIWFQFAALALASPIFTGAAICDERRARTLGTLLTTPLTAGQIVWGKLTSRVVQLMILALLAAPLILAIRVFGGLDGRIVLASTCVSLSTALLGASLGLMYSTWHRRATNAAVFGLLTLTLLQAAPSAIEGILFYTLNDFGARISSGPAGNGLDYPFHMNVLATCSAAVLAFLSQSAAVGIDPPDFTINWGATTLTLGPTWAVNAVYNTALSVGVASYATFKLRRIMKREGATEGALAAPAPRRRKARRGAATPGVPADAAVAVEGTEPALLAEIAPGEEDAEVPGREARLVSDRPVLWREVRQATFGSRRRFIAVALLAAGGLAWLYIKWGMGEEGVQATLAVLGSITVMLQPVFMTTGSIAGEREARTWEVLLSTPLSAWSILLGKAAGALRSQWFLPTLVLAHFALSALAGYVSAWLGVQMALIYLGPTLFFTATGQLFSLVFRKGVTAAACNLGLALLVWAGSWVALGLAGWFSDLADRSWYDYSGTVLFCFNPVAMAVSAMGPGMGGPQGHALSRIHHLSGMQDYTVTGWQFTMIAAGVALAYALGAAAALGLARLGFRRLGGRAS